MKHLLLFMAVLFMACAPLQAQGHKDTTHGKVHHQENKNAMTFERPGSLEAERKELHERWRSLPKCPAKPLRPRKK